MIGYRLSVISSACLLLAVVQVAHADVVGELHDWDPYPGAGGWTSEYNWVVLDTPTSGGNTGGFMSVTFTNTTGGLDSTWEDIIHTPATSLYAGAYSVSNWFVFDFFASNVLPNALQVRWKSSTNSYIWGNAIAGPTATNEWQSLHSSTLMNWDNWDIDPFGTEAQFLADLTDIEWVGIYIQRNTDVEQMYGIDNFALMIPEPAELIMLAAALAAVWMVYRRKERVGEVISNQ